jgi:hypothetical protein
VVPYPNAQYDTLILLMDSLRLMEPTDPPLFMPNKVTGNNEPVKTLFPEVVFGNLLGDS